MVKIRIAKKERCSGDWSLFISFPYDNRLIDIIRSFPSKYWNPNAKEWEVPFRNLKDVVDRMADQDIDITGVGAIEPPRQVHGEIAAEPVLAFRQHESEDVLDDEEKREDRD